MDLAHHPLPQATLSTCSVTHTGISKLPRKLVQSSCIISLSSTSCPKVIGQGFIVLVGLLRVLIETGNELLWLDIL